MSKWISKMTSGDSLPEMTSLEIMAKMPESEIAAMRAVVVRELPTQAPIFLPTEKIPLREQVTGLLRVRDIYRNHLDSIYRPRLRALREQFKHRQRCFVIGNGPSLNRTDLAMLKGEVTFGVNGFFLKARELDWCPTFYVVEDHLVAEDRRDAIEAFHGPTKLFPAYLGYCFRDSDDTIFFNHRPRKSYPQGFDFSTEADQITYTGCTVTFTCLQLAYYLGFQEIYLIGVDSDYAIPADAQHSKDYGVGVIDMKSDDTNHFHPDYFGKGFRWHDPQVHKMQEAYAEARLVTDRTGRSILNATVGGKLEVFERVAFNRIFPNARSPEEMARISADGLQGVNAGVERTGSPCENLAGTSDTARPDMRDRRGESPTSAADSPQHSPKVQKTEENRVYDDEMLAQLPRLLVFDITRRGDGTATGEIKATLLAGWPDDRLLQFYSVGRDQIGMDGIVPQVLGRKKSFDAEEISSVVRWFRPDIILYRPVPDNPVLHQVAMNLIRSSDLPLAVWIMDDWPSRLAAEDPALFARLDADLCELLARASLRLSICNAMSAAFQDRYGVAFKAFANAIDPKEWPLPERCDVQTRPFLLRYAGSLATNMGLASVRRVAGAVERLNSEGIDIRFEISTHPNWRKVAETEFQGFRCTSFATQSRTPAAYRAWLSEADALLIAYNFDELSKSYVRYSLANKLPECLASGAVLLAYGPSDVATIECIKSFDCGVVVTNEDEESVATALKGLIGDPIRRRELSERARSIAFDIYDVHRVRGALCAEFLAFTARKDATNGQACIPKNRRAARPTVALPGWVWSTVQSPSRFLLVTLLTVGILAAATADYLVLGYNLWFWSAAAASLLLTLGFVGISEGWKSLRSWIEVQRCEIDSRLQEHRTDLDRRMAALNSTLAAKENIAGEIQRSFDRRIGALQADLRAVDKNYRDLQVVTQLRDAVNAAVPREASVLVISKGDDEMLRLEGRKAWHFPQTENAVYAGHHPADSAAAIAHLEAMHARGANFLLVPHTAFWWFDHYTDFKRYLDCHYQRVPTRDCCIIYWLTNHSGSERAEGESRQ